MSIRIIRIKVNREGPLENDFILEAGDINLIYGHNETGKTYVVESIINILFRTGRESTVDWDLRDWDSAGSIVVSGLQDEPVTFSRAGIKLDDYWEERVGLPQDFSRLLVVKAGEAILAHQIDGVGRDILKNYLSGEGLLDGIQGRISTTLQKAYVEDGQIIGERRGEIKTRYEWEQYRKSIDNLLTDVEDAYASSDIYSLQRQQKMIEVELDNLQKAKCYYAASLHRKRNRLHEGKKDLASEEELSKIESDISIYEQDKIILKEKSDELAVRESTAENYEWGEKALTVYKEIMSRQAISGPNPIYMVFALILLVAAAVTGFFNLSIPLTICATGSIILLILYYVRMQRALAAAGKSTELQNLRASFNARFGYELTDIAALECQVGKLIADYSTATYLRQELKEKLIPNLKMKEHGIRETLKKSTRAKLQPQQWRRVVKELRMKLRKVNDKIGLLEKELATLSIPEEDFIGQDPGTKWDPKGNTTLNERLINTQGKLALQLENLNGLGIRIAQETNVESKDWEELITALRNRREEIARECRLITARILAKIQVNAVLHEFRKAENTRITEGLAREEVTKPLYAITGCYNRMRYEVDKGLVLTTDEDYEYPLAKISTGAKEQAFIALRIGFSSIIMKGQTAFLILDDAFEHSDWPRRTNLIDQVLILVEGGWQVFYFTMDDHIRDLFLTAREKLKDKFRYIELG